jgi:hypothetical protein
MKERKSQHRSLRQFESRALKAASRFPKSYIELIWGIEAIHFDSHLLPSIYIKNIKTIATKTGSRIVKL